MAQTKTQSSPAPSPVTILAVYITLGCLISFLAGREPGSLPENNIFREVAPVLIIVCGFLTSYSVLDVMAVGIAKIETNYHMNHSYKDLPNMPEQVYLATRVQANQVEQMPGFIVGSLGCALFVNGRVAGVLALVWAILRRRYASTYRGAVGVKFSEIGLSKYTIPAYFISNTMLMAIAIHGLRCLVRSG